MDAPEVILIDVGNTRIKSVEVINGTFAEQKVWESLEILDKSYPENIPFMVSSVKKLNYHMSRENVILNQKTPLPIKINYDTIETLGVDRIALAVGAYTLFPNQDSLVIDMGTCITIDLVDKSGIFQGGIIAPGLKMRMKAMANFTDNLPDISNSWKINPIQQTGKSTEQSLNLGAYVGTLFELNGFIEDFRQKFTSINIILNGGDAEYFERKVKPPIFAGLKIVERGLYEIWKYQLNII